LNLPAAKKRKLILTHADHKTRQTKGVRFGQEGETINIFSNKYPVPAHSVQNFIPLIKKTGLFSKLSSKEFKFLLENVEIETYSRGKYIFKQGEIGDKFYILLSGFAEVIKNNQVISIYEKGSFFGELALINRDRIRRASIRAKSKLLVMSMARECYKKFHLTTNIRERLYEFTNFFSESSLSSLVGYMSRGEFVVFMEGDDIIHYGDQDKDIYILLSGEVDILDYREKIIAHISNVEIFGEMAFLKEIPRTATVRVTSHEAAAICFKPNLFKEISEKFPSFNATALKKMEQRWEMLKRKKQRKK
jgi:cAMP-dependent protein kinase regulator